MMQRTFQDRFIRGIVDIGLIITLIYLILQLPQDNEGIMLALGAGAVAFFYFILMIEEVFGRTFLNN